MSNQDEVQVRKPFPAHLLPGPFGAMSKSLSALFQCNGNLPSMAVLGALNAAIGNRFLAINPITSDITPANLYLIGVGKSGDGKSQVMKQAYAPIMDYEASLVDTWTKHVRPDAKARKDLLECEISQIKSSHKAKAKKAIKAKDCLVSADGEEADMESFVGGVVFDTKLSEDSVDPVLSGRLKDLYRQIALVEIQLTPPRLIVDDCTPEKMVSLMANSPCLVSASAEARKAIGVLLGRYSKKNDDQPDEDVFLKAFSGDPIKVDRQGSGTIDVKDPCLSVFWMVQPGKADQLISSPTLRDSGFLQRCLFGYADSVLGNRLDSVSISADIRREYVEAINAVISHDNAVSGPGLVKLSKAAAIRVNELNEKYRKQWGEGDDQKRTFECRYAEMAVRLALNLHVASYMSSWGKREMDVSTVDSAIEILEFYTQNHADIFTSFDHNEAVWLRVQVSSLLKTFGRAFTFREAKRGPLGRRLGASKLEEFLEAEVIEKRLFRFQDGRTNRYTDDEAKTVFPAEPL